MNIEEFEKLETHERITVLAKLWWERKIFHLIAVVIGGLFLIRWFVGLIQ